MAAASTISSASDSVPLSSSSASIYAAPIFIWNTALFFLAFFFGMAAPRLIICCYCIGIADISIRWFIYVGIALIIWEASLALSCSTPMSCSCSMQSYSAIWLYILAVLATYLRLTFSWPSS